MVSEVYGCMAARPGISGSSGWAPAAMMIARVLKVRPLTSTVHGEVMRASPAITSTPSSV
ncbi:hypothetical protein D3C78_1144730 [compost metagenome]